MSWGTLGLAQKRTRFPLVGFISPASPLDGFTESICGPRMEKGREYGSKAQQAHALNETRLAQLLGQTDSQAIVDSESSGNACRISHRHCRAKPCIGNPESGRGSSCQQPARSIQDSQVPRSKPEPLEAGI